MTDTADTKIDRKVRWDAFLAAFPAVIVLNRLPIHGGLEGAIAYGVCGGGLWYAARWIFDRYRLGGGAKAAIILPMWLFAIFIAALLEP